MLINIDRILCTIHYLYFLVKRASMKPDFHQKVINSLNSHLELNDYVNITDVLRRMSWLQESHLHEWKQRLHSTLEDTIQCAPKKWHRACSIFGEAVENLDSIQAPWISYSLISDDKTLCISADNNTEIETLFNHYFFKVKLIF